MKRKIQLQDRKRFIKLGLAIILSFLLARISVCQTRPPAIEGSASSNRFQFEMDDKTRVIGTPDITHVNLDMGFDRISIPIQRVESIKRARQPTGGSESKFVVQLSNRDRFTGTVLNESIKVRFLAGEVVLPVKQIQSLNFVAARALSRPLDPAGLIFHFDFETDSKTTAKNLAVDRHHCKLNGAKIRLTSRGNRGVFFQSDTTLTVQHHLELCPQRFTLSAFVKPTGDRNAYAFILGKSQTEHWKNGYAFVYMQNDPTHIHFYVNGYQQQVVKTVVPSDKWSHLVGTCDGKAVVLYLNGKEAARVDYPKGVKINHESSSALTIGGDPQRYPWTGQIDEVAMHNRALTADEVNELFESFR